MRVLAQHWPRIYSIDLFGYCDTTLPPFTFHMPSTLRTVYLADSPCTDSHLHGLLACIKPGTLRELGLNWCRRLTDQGIIYALKKYGSSLQVLTLFSWSMAKTCTFPGSFVLDAAIQYMPQLMILDIEGSFASDCFFSQRHSSLTEIMSKNCFLSPEAVINALEQCRLPKLKKLCVSLTMLNTSLWDKVQASQASQVSQCCRHYRVTFQRHWSFSEENLSRALDC